MVQEYRVPRGVGIKITLNGEYDYPRQIDELKENSEDGRVAYIEALYHGGTGSKNAILFEDKTLVL